MSIEYQAYPHTDRTALSAPIINRIVVERDTNAQGDPKRISKPHFSPTRRNRRGTKGAGCQQRHLEKFRERQKFGRRENRQLGIKSPAHLIRIAKRGKISPEYPTGSCAGEPVQRGKKGAEKEVERQLSGKREKRDKRKAKEA